jgi:hypothetical protein
MTDIICDVCRKPVAEARKDWNYVTLMDKDLCLDCEEKLRVTMRKITKARQPVVFKEYQETLAKTLVKMAGGR